MVLVQLKRSRSIAATVSATGLAVAAPTVSATALGLSPYVNPGVCSFEVALEFFGA